MVAAAIAARPSLTLALPTGRTMVPFYRQLVARVRETPLDVAAVSTFNLDEFLGLPRGHRATYRAFMTRHLFAHVNLAETRTHVLDSDPADWRREAAFFESRIDAAGGLDLAVVGIGGNGHLAFNEPGDVLAPRTHRSRLHASTRRANASAFGGDWTRVPTHALTMGVATILRARRVLLLATGTHKAAIVRRALTGPVTTRVPASLLQLHPDATVVIDRAAGGRAAARAAPGRA
jgi:glucosamine-6-phosphate deaminase